MRQFSFCEREQHWLYSIFTFSDLLQNEKKSIANDTMDFEQHKQIFHTINKISKCMIDQK